MKILKENTAPVVVKLHKFRKVMVHDFRQSNAVCKISSYGPFETGQWDGVHPRVKLREFVVRNVREQH